MYEWKGAKWKELTDTVTILLLRTLFLHTRMVKKMLFYILKLLWTSQHVIKRSLQVSYSSSRYVVILQYLFPVVLYLSIPPTPMCVCVLEERGERGKASEYHALGVPRLLPCHFSDTTASQWKLSCCARLYRLAKWRRLDYAGNVHITKSFHRVFLEKLIDCCQHNRCFGTFLSLLYSFSKVWGQPILLKKVCLAQYWHGVWALL